MYKQQVVLVQSKIMKRFRAKVLKLHSTREVLSPDDEQQVLRLALLDYKKAIDELEVEDFGTPAGAAGLNDFSTVLQRELAEIPESALAKLEDIKKVDKNAQRPRKSRRGSPRFSVSLNLVGMIKPPGSGNLQGFAGYSSGIFGLPVDFLIGIQNDGDSPEASLI